MNSRRVIAAVVCMIFLISGELFGARLIPDEHADSILKEQQALQKREIRRQQMQTETPSVPRPSQEPRTPPEEMPPVESYAEENTVPVSVSSAVVQEDSTKYVTLDFDGVDIKVFIKFIADVTGRNFIIDDKVSGRVTIISPRKMAIDEAYNVFLSVLEVNGLGTVPSGEVTKIVRAADAITKSLDTAVDPPTIKDDMMITQIIPLRYADANNMRTLFTPLLSKGTSQILAYPQTNVLIITDTTSNIKKILEILEIIDVTGFAEELRIIPLTYASAADLSAKLGEILQEGRTDQVARLRDIRRQDLVADTSTTRIIPYERTNSLIVLAPPQRVEDIEKIIKRLDIPTPSGKEDIHVYYLQYANAEELAKVLSDVPTPQSPEAAPVPGTAPGARTTATAMRTTTSARDEIKITSDKETNALIIYADPYAYKTIVETIKRLDIPRRQVYVKALIMEISTQKDFKVGVEWTFFDDFTYDSGNRTGGVLARTGRNFVTGPGDLPSGALLGIVGEAITINSNGTQLTFPNITSFINAMAVDSDVNIISTPQIITMDNKEAEIKVGANIPYVTREDTDTTNINRTVRTFDYRDVGVTLRLTPQINQEGNIRLELFQESSTLVPGQGEQQFAPTTLKRSANTTVTIKDGSTMVIGGLIGDTLTVGNTRIPLLGDIPLLGHLFKSTAKNREKTNLYIFLTPHIIDTEERVETLYQEKQQEIQTSTSSSKKERVYGDTVHEDSNP